MLSSTLLTLLDYAKNEPTDVTPTWLSVREVLAPIYHRDMALADVVRVLVNTYVEALAERRFELPIHPQASVELLLAPITGHSAVAWLSPAAPNTLLTIEAFYNAMVRHIMSQLRIARVDWCMQLKRV